MERALRQLDPDLLYKLQQGFKWLVYFLLLVNLGFYVAEDSVRAYHTLIAGNASFLKVTQEFAASIDTSAWLILIAMFELETYTIEDKHWNKRVAWVVRGARIVCYVMIAHTLFAYSSTLLDYSAIRPVEGVTDLCEMTDQQVAYVHTLEYTAVTEETCDALTNQREFLWLGKNPLVTTLDGHQREFLLALADVVETIAWLLIIACVEVVVRLQGRGITGGRATRIARSTKTTCYVVLLILAAYWGALGLWLYVWDAFLWIAGFAVIEVNIAEWRDELTEHPATHGAAPT
ncbi:MAG: hypothetical protein AAF184_19935 [Pseudomonadota bacterium]